MGFSGGYSLSSTRFDIGIGFLEASALDGTNADEAFLRCARQILTKVELGHIVLIIRANRQGRSILHHHIQEYNMEMRRYILILHHYSEQVQELFYLLSMVMPGGKLN